MIIWRGAGILAVLIFGLIFIGGYALDKTLPPHFLSGYYIFIAALLGGIATWKVGHLINTSVYRAQQENPDQTIYTHSLFFIPMEWSAIPLTLIAILFGLNYTIKENEKKARDEKSAQIVEDNFREEIALMDSLIQNPEVGDYYHMRFMDKENGQSQGINYNLPLRVTEVEEDKIRFFYPLNKIRNKGLRIYYQEDIVKVFSENQEEGSFVWIDKSKLLKGIKRTMDMEYFPEITIPDFTEGLPTYIKAVWRINGPVLERYRGDWNSSKLDLLVQNNGLPFTITIMRYKGNKPKWKKYIPGGSVKQNGIDYKEDDVVRMNQKFFLYADQVKEEEALIWLFCTDSEGRKFRFDIERDETGKIVFERNRL